MVRKFRWLSWQFSDILPYSSYSAVYRTLGCGSYFSISYSCLLTSITYRDEGRTTTLHYKNTYIFLFFRKGSNLCVEREKGREGEKKRERERRERERERERERDGGRKTKTDCYIILFTFSLFFSFSGFHFNATFFLIHPSPLSFFLSFFLS